MTTLLIHHWRRPLQLLAVLFLAGLTVVLTASISRAAVIPGAGGLPIADGAGDQSLILAGPGDFGNDEWQVPSAGNLIVAYKDGTDLRLQKVSSTAQKLWGTNGVSLGQVIQNSSFAYSDGSDGVVVVWQEGPAGTRILAQRFTAAGSPLWNGGSPVAVVSAAASLSLPEVIQSSATQWIIMHLEKGGVNHTIKARRLNNNGSVEWDDGGGLGQVLMQVANQTNFPGFTSVMSGSGDFFLVALSQVWSCFPVNCTDDKTAKFSPVDGTPQWPSGQSGQTISGFGPTVNGLGRNVIDDQAGGFWFVTYFQSGGPACGGKAKALHVDSNGNVVSGNDLPFDLPNGLKATSFKLERTSDGKVDVTYWGVCSGRGVMQFNSTFTTNNWNVSIAEAGLQQSYQFDTQLDSANNILATIGPLQGGTNLGIYYDKIDNNGVRSTPSFRLICDPPDPNTFGAVRLGLANDVPFIVWDERRTSDYDIFMPGSPNCELPFETTDLLLTKTDAVDPVAPGQDIVYTLTATNNGTQPTTATTVIDTLPSSPATVALVSVVPSSGSCSTVGNTITCNLGPLAPGVGSSKTIVITVTPPIAGVYTNQATVNGSSPDGNPVNNSDSEDTTVQSLIPPANQCSDWGWVRFRGDQNATLAGEPSYTGCQDCVSTAGGTVCRFCTWAPDVNSSLGGAREVACNTCSSCAASDDALKCRVTGTSCIDDTQCDIVNQPGNTCAATCGSCSDCAEYGVNFSSQAGQFFGYAWSGGGGLPINTPGPDTSTPGVGWISFSPARGSVEAVAAWVQTRFGDIYSGGGVGRPGGVPSGEAPLGQFNATFVIEVEGTPGNEGDITWTSATGNNDYLRDQGSDFRLPSPANPNQRLGRLDFVELKRLTNNIYTPNVVEINQANVNWNTMASLCGFDPNNTLLNRTICIVNGNLTVDSPVVFRNGANGNENGSGTIVVGGDLVIEDNIQYDQNALPGNATISQLASVAWIVEGDVTVDPAATTIVGAFIAIPTNANPAAGVVRTGTGTTLDVRGLMMARLFDFQRTQSTPTTAAETITYDGRIIANSPPGTQDIANLLPQTIEVFPRLPTP